MKRLGDFALPGRGAGLPGKGPDCQTCDDTGWMPVDRTNRAKGVIKCTDCYERRRGFAPGVPDDAAKISLDAYNRGELQKTSHNESALLQAKFFLDGVHPGLYLHGCVGSGKTILACAILNDLHRAGKTVRFVRVTDLLKQLVQHDTGDQVHDKMVAVPVLCLDDIGSQRGTDYASRCSTHAPTGATGRSGLRT